MAMMMVMEMVMVMVHDDDDDDDDDDDAISIQCYFLFTPLQYLYRIDRHIKPVLFILSDCSSYSSLTDASRKMTYVTVSVWCDSGITPGWYRFEGSAGTKMPTTCVPGNRCNTHGAGWLNGVHPTVAEGQVSQTVCFSYSNNCCRWSTTIQVRNCGAFYIYYFSGTPSCYLRYCGTD